MYEIVTLKAFGDFLIACNALRFSHSQFSKNTVSIIASSHVQPLAEALNISNENISYISDPLSNEVPAVFDIKKQGGVSALKSLISIRRQIKYFSPDAELIFDHLGWRERIIGFGRKIHGLPKSVGNIYVAYDQFLESIGYTSEPDALTSINNIRRAVIIPGARMDFRVIPHSVISSAYRELESRNIEVKVILLEGEQIIVPQNLTVEVLPRNFTSLISVIKDSGLVISADSLPAHMSAFLNVPSFVFTPIPEWTSYWLPKSALYTQGMATFSDMKPFPFWLDKFLYSNFQSV